MTATMITSSTTDRCNDQQKWQALLSRNPAAEGCFVYSVRTTGIYCRPTCSARLARRENVTFHNSCYDAEHAGFRACKRCHPNQVSTGDRSNVAITAACRLIERSEEMPTLQTLARHVGLSRFHFHRLFKDKTGLTPKAYATAHQARRVREELVHSSSVTEAIYDAGFNSSGRFYEKSTKVLGMTPTEFRAGGSGKSIEFAVGDCSLGVILVAASEKGICAILLGDDPDRLVRNIQDRFPNAEFHAGDARFERWMAKVVGLVEAPNLGHDLPLDIRGTAFQQRVWQALSEIPVGSTLSYAEVAASIGRPNAARAVAAACAANSLAVAIPCHRVVRADGGLSGYRWGVERKSALLAKELAA